MDGDYKHPKRARKGFIIQGLGEYHALCVQRDTYYYQIYSKTSATSE